MTIVYNGNASDSFTTKCVDEENVHYIKVQQKIPLGTDP